MTQPKTELEKEIERIHIICDHNCRVYRCAECSNEIRMFGKRYASLKAKAIFEDKEIKKTNIKEGLDLWIGTRIIRIFQRKTTYKKM